MRMKLPGWRKLIGWCALGAVLLGGLPGGGAAAGETTEITRRVVTAHYTLAGDALRVPGYSLNDAPGAPRLPVHGMVVALPATGEWELMVDTAGSRVLPQHPAIPPAPAPAPAFTGAESWTRQPELPAVAPVHGRPDPAIYQADAFYPTAPAVAGHEQWQRGRRLLAVRVFPFQYNPVTREVLHHPEVIVTVRVRGAAEAVPAPAAKAASAGAGLTGPADAPDAPFGALRILTGQRGLYRLTYDDLLAAGVPLDAVNPASFFITHRGQTVQIQVIGEADGAFDPGDLVVFHAEPYQGRYMAHNVYRFYWRGQPAPPLARMSTRAAAPTGAEPAVTAITQTLRIESDKAYYSDYPLPQDADHWFDDPIYPTTASPVEARTYTLAVDDPLATGEVRFRAQLYGGKEQAPDPDQSVALRLNGHDVTTWQWKGRVGYLAEAAAPAAWLDVTPGTVTLEAALSQLPVLSEYWVYPDWLEVAYPAQPDAEGDRILIEGIDAPGPTMQITVTGFTTDTARIYDIRRPLAPVQLTASEAISDGVSYSVHFWDAWAADDPPASYALATPEALLAPVSVAFDQPSSWSSMPHAADYIAIVHRSLWDAIQPLLDYRGSQGLAVAKVDVQDIYDEFNDGLTDPEAIREFLAFAYANWHTEEGPPRYVLLVGDGHYDFKGVSGTTLPNLIPPYLIAVDPWIGETAADNRYVSVDGPDDYLADMAIGRIPARNPADVTAVVDKTLAYEDILAAPDGAWQSRASFVADNWADPAGNFHALSDEVRLSWLPPALESRTIYWNKDFTDAWAMNTAIKEAFTDSVLVQWFGHASRFRWGSTQVFSIFTQLYESPQWPLSVHYSCWTGYFINLSSNYQALGEHILIQPGKGPVADFSPSGLHIGNALLTLNEGLTLAVFRDRIRPVGDAANQAKLYFFANSAAWHDVVDTQILFGDPALALRVPATPPNPPAVAIAAGDASARLSWPHSLDSSQYEVWRGTAPYFDPDAGGAALVTTVDAGFRGAGPGFEQADDGTSPPPAVQIIGDPATNYFWVVRSRNGDGASEPSNRVGEFDFRLTPGQ